MQQHIRRGLRVACQQSKPLTINSSAALARQEPIGHLPAREGRQWIDEKAMVIASAAMMLAPIGSRQKID